MFLLIGIIVEMILDVLKKPKEFREVILNGFKVVSAITMHGGGSGLIYFEAIDRDKKFRPTRYCSKFSSSLWLKHRQDIVF